MSCKCPSPDSASITTSSSKTTSSKGKNCREVVEEVDNEKVEESDKEEQLKKQERKRARKAKVTPSDTSSSCTPISTAPSETDDEEDPPSYQSTCVSIMRTLAQFPLTQHSQLTDSLADDEGF